MFIKTKLIKKDKSVYHRSHFITKSIYITFIKTGKYKQKILQ